MLARVDPAKGIAAGDLTVSFIADIPTDRLVFRLWPNGPVLASEGAHLDAGPVSDHRGRPVRWELTDPTTLTVFPRERLRGGDGIIVSMPWRLTIPPPVLDRIAGDSEVARLGSFFPILSWEPGVGWATDPPTSTLAESSTSPIANFDVDIRTPPGYQVLATGLRVTADVWHAEAVRDFAIAVGHFDVATNVLYLPDQVNVTVGVQRGVFLSPADLLTRLNFTLGELAIRYGEYAWRSFTLVVTRDVGRSGIEYPTLVFEGSEGIDRVTTHELAHQWFYSLVGNDQARDPWLDEALATWAAANVDGYLGYLQGLKLKDTPLERVGSSMAYWDRRPNAYQPGVYVRGVQALAALGRPGLVDCALRLYAASRAFAIATPGDLLDALAAVFPDAERKLRPFGIRR
jgi:peptidase M1-like protein